MGRFEERVNILGITQLSFDLILKRFNVSNTDKTPLAEEKKPAETKLVAATPVGSTIVLNPVPLTSSKKPNKTLNKTLNKIPKKILIFKRIRHKISRMLFICVILPTLLSAIYYGLIASDVYISESSFVVRAPRTQSSAIGIGALLQGAGFARAQDDTYTVHEFMHSRDALTGLTQQLSVQDFYNNGMIDMISRFNPLGLSDSNEAFYQYFQNKIVIDLNSNSSISTLKIKAFRAEDAQKINESLLIMGEMLINQLNTRGRQDMIDFSQRQIDEAEAKVKTVSEGLNAFRVKNNIFDLPEQINLQSKLVLRLQDELISIKTQLAQVMSSTSKNPQVKSLESHEQIIRAEIAQQMSLISGSGNTSLASKAAEYERLRLDNKFAEQQLESALTAYENAINEAQKKQLYLERITQPSLPDASLEPYRIRNILSTLILSLIIFSVLRLLISSAREHRD